MLKLSSKKNFIRTDLAIESKEIFNTSQIDGVKIITQDFKNIKVTTVKIINQIGEENLNKPLEEKDINNDVSKNSLCCAQCCANCC